MTKRMLVDSTHPEETRVAIVDSYRDQHRLEDLDFDLASKPLLKGNIYLAKVMRVEPSLQAAFVEYGGNRHGFLSFSEIHPDYFRIPMADRSNEEGDEDQELDEQETENLADYHEELQQAEGAEEAPPSAIASEFAGSANVEIAQETQILQPIGSFEPSAVADVGLITDFGNAVVDPQVIVAPTSLEEPIPVESIGGEFPERVVRQHRPRYKIQEVVKRGMVMLIQVVKEERGNKGAALTTFLSLAGRYCVLMPNTDHGGGVSRKITNHQDRRRMKEILDQLEIPEGMAVILRTAGMEQDPPEIQRDLEFLLRLWDSIREQTLQSTAPALIYEEANLIKRSLRDLFSRDIDEILVAGQEGHARAHDFIRAMMPDQVSKIRLYQDPIPLFFRYQVENQIDGLHSPIVQLRSGGYIVINPTEALVSIDVNSGKATRERHIEETAVKTNLEAADEIARQLRLRDLAGLVVIDFIDMEDNRNNAAVERRIKEAMKNDRARLQIGRISPFGLLELSRQRLRPSLLEINFEKCPHCAGLGLVRSIDSAALSILRVIEEEGIKQGSAELVLHVPTKIALYLLNQKRISLSAIEQRYSLHVLLHSDDALVPPDYRLERARARSNNRLNGPAVNSDQLLADTERDMPVAPYTIANDVETSEAATAELAPRVNHGNNNRGRGRDRFRDRNQNRGQDRDRGNPNRRDHSGRPAFAAADTATLPPAIEGELAEGEEINFNALPEGANSGDFNSQENQQKRRRRGRRGGRRRNGQGEQNSENRWERRPPRDRAEPSAATLGDTNGNNYAPQIPASIHDIDTTPRVPSQQNYQHSTAYSNGDHVSAPRSSHEIINPPAEKPKGGWWRKLTGQ